MLFKSCESFVNIGGTNVIQEIIFVPKGNLNKLRKQ